MSNWQINVKNVGMLAAAVTNYDDTTGIKRPVAFSTKKDAQEAARIIHKLRRDTTIEYVEIFEA